MAVNGLTAQRKWAADHFACWIAARIDVDLCRRLAQRYDVPTRIYIESAGGLVRVPCSGLPGSGAGLKIGQCGRVSGRRPAAFRAHRNRKQLVDLAVYEIPCATGFERAQFDATGAAAVFLNNAHG